MSDAKFADASIYQTHAHTTSKYQSGATKLLQGEGNIPIQDAIAMAGVLLGMMSELGELADDLDKYIRSGGEKPLDKTHVAEEATDLLWGASEIITLAGFDLGMMMRWNLEKLANRETKGQNADGSHRDSI